MRADLESRIEARAADFHLVALLRLLFDLGYSWDTILFEGTRTEAQAPRIVHSVEFQSGGSKRVIVRLNRGLLSPNGALPSYFQKFAEGLEDPRAFLAFIRFLDHVVLRNHAFATCPELGPARNDGDREHGNGPLLASAYRAVAGVDSLPQLHWLFRAVVPELPVSVTTATFKSDRPDQGARFGGSRLDGSAILGPKYRTESRGYLVRLHAEDELDERGRRWEDIVADRWTKSIVPALGRLRPAVELRISFDSYATGAQVAPSAQLGRRRIRTKLPEAWEVVVAVEPPPPGA